MGRVHCPLVALRDSEWQRARQFPNLAAVTSKLAVVLLLVAAPLIAQSNGTSADRSVATGVYADDQAVRGRIAFESYCASCHEPSFHSGDQFRMGWFGRSVYDLFRVIKTTMPEDNIGGLSDDEYTRIIAYILQLNGFPAGKDSLAADSVSMRRLRIGPPSASADSSRKRR